MQPTQELVDELCREEVLRARATPPEQKLLDGPRPYMLVGALSSRFYGTGRTTKDADFVIELGEHSILEVGRRLGSSFRIDPQTSFETVTRTRRFVADVVGTGLAIEFFHLTSGPHDQGRFRRRREVRLLAGCRRSRT